MAAASASLCPSSWPTPPAAARRRRNVPGRCRGEAGRVGRWPAALSSFVPGCGPAVDGVQDRLRSLRRKISQGGPGRACQPWPFRLDAGLPPGPAPLDHVATAEDVKAGKAVFHLDGKGKLTDLKLPAVGLLIPDDKKKRWSTVLIVQAEVMPTAR